MAGLEECSETKAPEVYVTLIPRDGIGRGGSVSKESACHAEDPGLIPGSGRSPGEGNGTWASHSITVDFCDMVKLCMCYVC